MFSAFALLFLFLFICFLLFFHCFIWKRHGLPPGPAPLPLIGNLLAIALDPPGYGPFRRWAATYGPVYTVWFGEDPHVVVTDFGLLKETGGEQFAGRHFSTNLFPHFAVIGGRVAGIIRTEGEEWRVLRRYSMRSMRNLGIGRSRMERKMLAHLEEMFGQIRARMDLNGVASHVHLEPLLDLLSGAVISQLVFGCDFRGERVEHFHELKRMMNRVQAIQGSTRGQLLDSMPWLRHIAPFGHTFRQFDQAMAELYGFFDRQIEAKLEQRRNSPGKRVKEMVDEEDEEEEKDFVDQFLDEMDARKADQKEKNNNNYFTMASLRGLCFDLFVAGQETSTNTLSFLMLYLMLDQQVQRKMHAELDALCIGEGQMLGMSDRAKLPLVCAVINETQRLCNLLPINLSHRTVCSAQIGPYKVPAGTPMLPQISSVLADDRVFPEPDRFRPERFLDEQGRLKKCEELIPFGIGKRQCAGESLARMELFLFTANFFNQFRVFPVDPLNPPAVQKRTLLTVMPQEYLCRIVDRRWSRFP